MSYFGDRSRWILPVENFTSVEGAILTRSRRISNLLRLRWLGSNTPWILRWFCSSERKVEGRENGQDCGTHLDQVGLRMLMVVVGLVTTPTASGPDTHDSTEQVRHGTANTALFRMRRTTAHERRARSASDKFRDTVLHSHPSSSTLNERLSESRPGGSPPPHHPITSARSILLSRNPPHAYLLLLLLLKACTSIHFVISLFHSLLIF